jgi:hypothetical protein
MGYRYLAHLCLFAFFSHLNSSQHLKYECRYIFYFFRVETDLPKKQTPSYSSNLPTIAVRLEYTALPPILLEQPAGWPVPEVTLGGKLPGMLHFCWKHYHFP